MIVWFVNKMCSSYVKITIILYQYVSITDALAFHTVKKLKDFMDIIFETEK